DSLLQRRDPSTDSKAGSGRDSQGHRPRHGNFLSRFQLPGRRLPGPLGARRIQQPRSLGRVAGVGGVEPGGGFAMNGIEALARLRNLGVPVVTTADAAAVLRLSTAAASHTLRRLARAGLAVPVRRGLWVLDRDMDPLLLPEHLTAPYPSYVSLQTALFRHGLISQIPSMTYAITLG